MALATQRASQRDSGRDDKEDGRHTGRQQVERRDHGLALQTALLFGPTTMLGRHLGARGRCVPFGDGVTLPILSAEDLTVFKVIFDRAKDWTGTGTHRVASRRREHGKNGRRFLCFAATPLSYADVA